MKKIILLLASLNFCTLGYCQIIKGTILDQSNGSIVNYAIVYINGTSLGTYSNKDGHFELDITKYRSMPLTISALGYYSKSLVDFSKDKPIIVYLIPKIFELKEVVINSKVLSKERKARLLIFKNEFLGMTENGKNCEILNESDISFSCDNECDTLRAFASKPLLIINNQLGYKIAYYLDKFEYYQKSKSFTYRGSVVFNKDFADTVVNKQVYSKRRKYTYLGSRMHFFRSLFANNLKSAGFTVTNDAYEKLDSKAFVVQGDSLKKYLVYPEKLGVCYYAKYPSTYIIFLKERIVFDKDGYYDPLGIVWDGRMAKQRIGDLLPYEY